MLAIALRACPVDVVPGPIKAKEVKAPVTIVGEDDLNLKSQLNDVLSLLRASSLPLDQINKAIDRFESVSESDPLPIVHFVNKTPKGQLLINQAKATCGAREGERGAEGALSQLEDDLQKMVSASEREGAWKEWAELARKAIDSKRAVAKAKSLPKAQKPRFLELAEKLDSNALTCLRECFGNCVASVMDEQTMNLEVDFTLKNQIGRFVEGISKSDGKLFEFTTECPKFGESVKALVDFSLANQGDDCEPKVEDIPDLNMVREKIGCFLVDTSIVAVNLVALTTKTNDICKGVAQKALSAFAAAVEACLRAPGAEGAAREQSSRDAGVQLAPLHARAWAFARACKLECSKRGLDAALNVAELKLLMDKAGDLSSQAQDNSAAHVAPTT